MKLTKKEKEAIAKALKSKESKAHLCPFEREIWYGGVEKICARCHKLFGTKPDPDSNAHHPCQILGVREVVRRARKLLEEQA